MNRIRTLHAASTVCAEVALRICAGVLIAGSVVPALAQSPVLEPGHGASSPARTRNPPRVAAPVIRPEPAPPVLDPPPEGKVEPLINVPWGKKSGAAASAPSRGASRAGRGGPGVSDSAARCEAELDAAMRAKCLAGLAHETPGK